MGILKAGKKLSPAQVGLVEALEILKKEIQRRPNDRVKWLQKNNETMIMPIPKEGRQVAVLEKAHKDHDTDVICIDPSAEMKSVAASGTDDQGIQQIAEAFEI
jgi:molybdopterin biosynthesis enzyme